MAISQTPAARLDTHVSMSIIRNLVIECDNSAQVVIKDGSVVGADDGGIIATSGDVTVDITVSGAGGLDTGVEASDTWYYIYLIYDPDNDLVDGLLSLSATSPTLPGGYTQKRLVGAVRNNGSSNFNLFKQNGNLISYATGELFASATDLTQISGGGTLFALTSIIPERVNQVFLHIDATNLSGSLRCLISGSHDGVSWKRIVSAPINGQGSSDNTTEMYVNSRQVYLGKGIAQVVQVNPYIHAYFMDL